MSSVSSARPVAFAAGQLFAGNGFFRGYTLRETAGAVATVRLFDNNSATGLIIATIAFAANESKAFNLDGGAQLANGLFAQVLAGAVEGAVFLG